MDDLASIAALLSQRCFMDVAYFGVVHAMKSPSAEAHMLAGVGCCGCVEPLAIAQRLVEGVAVRDEDLASSMPPVSPATELPYEGFFHLIEAIRRDPAIAAPPSLCEVFDAVADDLAYFSRRELHRPPDRRKRYTLREASLCAAVLLRRLARTDRALPGAAPTALDIARSVIEQELRCGGGDAKFQAGKATSGS